jgi:hypothetical protein
MDKDGTNSAFVSAAAISFIEIVKIGIHKIKIALQLKRYRTGRPLHFDALDSCCLLRIPLGLKGNAKNDTKKRWDRRELRFQPRDSARSSHQSEEPPSNGIWFGESFEKAILFAVPHQVALIPDSPFPPCSSCLWRTRPPPGGHAGRSPSRQPYPRHPYDRQGPGGRFQNSEGAHLSGAGAPSRQRPRNSRFPCLTSFLRPRPGGNCLDPPPPAIGLERHCHRRPACVAANRRRPI